MVRIQKEHDIKLVTQGAYEDFYEHLGYTIIKDKSPVIKETKKIETKNDNKKKDNDKLTNYSRK